MEAIRKLLTIDSIVLSNYILKHHGPMSHLKLQKLLFYCDAYHLAYFDVELIKDKFEAWVHGPVCRRVYDNLKDKSILFSDIAYSDMGLDEDRVFDNLASDQKDLLNDVFNLLCTWTARELEAATHQERPWIEARIGYAEGDKCHVEISKETTRIFYKADLS